MSIAGEVCALVRGAKDVQVAIQIAADVYAISCDQVVAYLKEYGLMDGAGTYLPPSRRTGKENDMARFMWSAARVEELGEMLESSHDLEQIAKHFDIPVYKVEEAVKKYHTPKAKPDAAPTDPISLVDQARKLCQQSILSFSNGENAAGYIALGQLDIMIERLQVANRETTP